MNEASAADKRSAETQPDAEHRESVVDDDAAAGQHKNGSATAAADVLQAEEKQSAQVVAAQHTEKAADDAGPSTANGDAGKLNSRTHSAIEAPKPPEGDGKPARTGSGNRHQNPATCSSPQTAVKQCKGQRTMQSFFTSKPSS